MEKVWIVTLIGAVLSLGIELLQYTTGSGLCELDDWFHNTLGTFSGYQIFVILNFTVAFSYGQRSATKLCNKRKLGLSLSYIIAVCLFFSVLIYLNKPDWTNVFY